MKHSFLLIPALCLVAGVSCNQTPEYDWEENFDGPEIDLRTWTKIPRGKPTWAMYMSDYEGLYDIKDGCLVLRGIANNGITDDPTEFITGGLSSEGKKSFGYGRLDIRAKMKDVMGSWPAIWLLPNDGTRWPYGGEIDIMERLNYDDYAYQTVHSEYTQYGPGDKFQPYGGTAPMVPGEFNVYSFEHYPDSLIMSINGVRGLKYTKDPEATEYQWPFDRDYYFILSMQLNCDWCGPTDIGDLPDEMLIDWIRFTSFDCGKSTKQ